MKKLGLLVVIVIFLQFVFPCYVHAQAGIKELNFVFLHGAGGHADSMQSLSDTIMSQIKDYIARYEHDNPGITIKVNSLLRGYQNDEDIATWANNVAGSVNNFSTGKKDLILIGHSMGGKTALYAVSHNIQGLGDKTAMVVTINSPILALNQYFATAGGPVYDYCRASYLLSDHGVCDSVTNYDSTTDGEWVANNKHWLAFISAESAPASAQFNRNGLDPATRDQDDGVVPISAQYTNDADVVYYGEHGHSDFNNLPDVTHLVSEKILSYIFGSTMECSVPQTSGIFEHRASWLPVKYTWNDTFGEKLTARGEISHVNKRLFKEQYWEDIVGNTVVGTKSSYKVRRSSFPWFTKTVQVQWQNSNTIDDSRLYIKTWAAPKNVVSVEWQIYTHDLLPTGVIRDHYEIKINNATPQAGIPQASWYSNDIQDVRLQVDSNAMGPFRWYQAEWKVFVKQPRFREVIKEIPTQQMINSLNFQP